MLLLATARPAARSCHGSGETTSSIVQKQMHGTITIPFQNDGQNVHLPVLKVPPPWLSAADVLAAALIDESVICPLYIHEMLLTSIDIWMMPAMQRMVCGVKMQLVVVVLTVPDICSTLPQRQLAVSPLDLFRRGTLIDFQCFPRIQGQQFELQQIENRSSSAPCKQNLCTTSQTH